MAYSQSTPSPLRSSEIMEENFSSFSAKPFILTSKSLITLFITSSLTSVAAHRSSYLFKARSHLPIATSVFFLSSSTSPHRRRVSLSKTTLRSRASLMCEAISASRFELLSHSPVNSRAIKKPSYITYYSVGKTFYDMRKEDKIKRKEN